MTKADHVDSDGLVLRRAVLAEILPLRHRILRPGLPIESAQFDGDAEPQTLQVGAFVAAGETDGAAGRCVCCLSVMRRPLENEPAWQLRGMATDVAWQRQGVGGRLLKMAEQQLAAHREAVGVLWCNARVEAVGFYQRHGWRVVSAVFEVHGVGPHRKMVRG